MRLTNIKKTITLLIVAVACSACTFNDLNKDFVLPKAKLYAPDFHLLTLGMSKSEVIEKIGDPDQHIGAKLKDGKTIETWEYFRYDAVPGPDQISERYQVVFTDGILTSYESSGDSKHQVNIKN